MLNRFESMSLLQPGGNTRYNIVKRIFIQKFSFTSLSLRVIQYEIVRFRNNSGIQFINILLK